MSTAISKYLKYWREILLLSAALLITFLFLEILIRLHHSFIHGIPFFVQIGYEREDPQLGWRGVEIMGDVQSRRFKVFFVGDSFTSYEAGEVELDPENMYYGVVKKYLNVELFVYGGQGYGTLQEYMIIDKYIDRIKPDLVVLQVCSNDFFDNRWALEKESWIHNNFDIRPYYENGKVAYHYPGGHIFLREYLLPYSRLIYFLMDKIDRKMYELASKGYIRTIEKDIETKGVDLKEFRESILVTSELIGKIKRRCGDIPIIAFSALDDEPYFSQFKLLFKNNNIDFLEEIPKLAWDAELKNNGANKVRNACHWREAGHDVCGRYLAQYIKSHK